MEDTSTPEKTQIFNGMTFYMRPCSARSNIRNYLEEHGGTFSKKSDGNVIILTDTLTHNTGYHIDLIHHSIDKNELQDINKYKLPSYNFKNVTNNTKVKVPCLQINKARQNYIPEEDEAIFKYITKFGTQNGEIGSIGGNLIWKEMERKRVTIHSWQSMKNRYNNHIKDCPPRFYFKPLEMGISSDNVNEVGIRSDNVNEVGIRSDNVNEVGIRSDNVNEVGIRSDNVNEVGIRSDNVNEVGIRSDNVNEVGIQSDNVNEMGIRSDNVNACHQKESSTHEFINNVLPKNVSQTSGVQTINVSKIKNDGDKCLNATLTLCQEHATPRDDSDEFDVNLFKQAEQSIELTPSIFPGTQNSTSDDGPMFCECYENYHYTEAAEILQHIDDIPADNHIWRSISNRFIIEDVALKYGMSSDQVEYIIEKHFQR